jgi:phytoene dehydrogenase-like protein
MGASYDVIVIGAGHNGLTAAAYLARAGKKVLVLERRPLAGGAAVTEEIHPGFRISTCAHWVGLLQPRIVRELELGRHGLEILRPEAALFQPRPDGSHLLLWRDRAKALAEIARHSAADAERYPAFAERLGRLTGFLRPLLLSPPPFLPKGKGADLLALLEVGLRFRRLGAREIHQALRWLPMSVADLVSEWFEGEALKALLAARGIVGSFLGPRSPGTAALLLYENLGEPGWPLLGWGVPRGGMGSVTAALAEAAKRYAAEIRTGAEVARIEVKNQKAVGVVLATGEEILVPVVVSNPDCRTTFDRLVDPALLDPHFLGAIRKIKFRGAVAKVNLAVAELPDFKSLPGKTAGLQHQAVIQIGPSLDYLERAFDDAKYGRFSARPFLEVVIPSVLDPTLAPAGKHVISILAQFAPYHLREGNWNEKREALGDAVVRTLAEHAPNLPGAILHRQVLTPGDLESIYGLPEGNIYHGEQTLDQLFFMRPVPGWARYRTPIQNLYLCGAGTHPGGGVSGAPGYNAAREILRDWKKGEIR